MVPRRLRQASGRKCGSWTSTGLRLLRLHDRHGAPGGAELGSGRRRIAAQRDGLLWRLDLEPEVELSVVPIENLPPINNDHVLDPPRGLIYMSANDGHIYVAPVTGGTAGP